MKFVSKAILFIRKAISKLFMYCILPLFKKTGKNVRFNPMDDFSYENIEIGNDVWIGNGACFKTITSIKIGNKVMFGPNVSIMGGDHNTSQIGEFMYDVKFKLPENDLPIVIENDVWVGTRAIILKGVTIGEGSVIAAGALVTKNVAPYTIVGGVPARKLKNRFTEDQLKEHIDMINKKALAKLAVNKQKRSF